MPTFRPLNYEDGNVIIRIRTRFPAAFAATLYRGGRIETTTSLDEALKSIPSSGLDVLVEYRVHRGILSSHSAVFLNHFRGGETILNGCKEEHDNLAVLTLSEPYVNIDPFLKTMYLPEYVIDFLSSAF